MRGDQIESCQKELAVARKRLILDPLAVKPNRLVKGYRVSGICLCFTYKG